MLQRDTRLERPTATMAHLSTLPRRQRQHTMCSDFLQLQGLRLNNNSNLTTFLSEWKFCLQGMLSIPDDTVLEVLFNQQIARCDHLQPILNIYHTDVVFRGQTRSYRGLLKIVETHIEDRRTKKLQDTQINETTPHGEELIPFLSHPPLLPSRLHLLTVTPWPQQEYVGHGQKNGDCSKKAACPYASAHTGVKKQSKRQRNKAKKKAKAKTKEAGLKVHSRIGRWKRRIWTQRHRRTQRQRTRQTHSKSVKASIALQPRTPRIQETHPKPENPPEEDRASQEARPTLLP